MATLKKGSKGAEVKKLQQRLEEKGFRPGVIDGKFGPGTDAAVRAFQASEDLLVDGVVGRRTLEALGGVVADVEPDPPLQMKRVSINKVSKMFPGAKKKNIKTYLPAVLTELSAVDLAEKSMVLMALATIRAETAGFKPISEFKSKFNTSPGGEPFDLYDNRRDLGNRGSPDGALFKGRGFIQLTGRDNYQRIGKAIGLGDQLEKEPELANDPEIAARILCAFLKTKERRIKQELLANNLKAARRLVNGGSHGLKQFKEAYHKGDRLLKTLA